MITEREIEILANPRRFTRRGKYAERHRQEYFAAYRKKNREKINALARASYAARSKA